MNDTALIHSITPARMTEVLQAAGYRVSTSEQNGVMQLLSASQGVGYAVRFGNPATEAGAYLDYTLSCALRVQGELPDGLVGRWNSTKRFARLSRQDAFLVLEMDVVVAGGVAEQTLRVNTEIWDRLLQEFLLFLRNFAAQAAEAAKELAAAATASPAAVKGAPTAAAATSAETVLADALELK
jgi:hypothetical protein